MDRDEKKFEVFLSLHRKNLTVADLKIFLPFTINLDPFIKKVIKDEMQNLESLGIPVLAGAGAGAGGRPPPLTRRQAVGLSRKMGGDMAPPQTAPHPQSYLHPHPYLHPTPGYLPPYLWPPA